MARPFRVRHPRFIGFAAIAMALALLTLYLPGSPSALVWPYEWAMLLVWGALGLLLYLARRRHFRSH